MWVGGLNLGIYQKISVVLLVIAVAVGLSVFSYFSIVDKKPYPGLKTDNRVSNETISVNFANYTSFQPFESNYSIVTVFSYHNSSSNLTLNVFSYVFYDSAGHLVNFDLHVNVRGNVSSVLRPTGIQVKVSNTWSNSLNIDNVASWDAGPSTLEPYNNVSTLKVSSTAGGGGEPFYGNARLLNQTNSEPVNQFGLNVGVLYEYFTLSYYSYQFTGANIGEDTLHFTVSLQGLGQPVYATVNLLLMNGG